MPKAVGAENIMLYIVVAESGRTASGSSLFFSVSALKSCTFFNGHTVF